MSLPSTLRELASGIERGELPPGAVARLSRCVADVGGTLPAGTRRCVA